MNKLPSILIIDDEKPILQTLKKALALQGINCETTESAIQGLTLHKKNLFPVVLTDISMPEMTGIDFLREAKRIHPTCLIYIMTGYTSMSKLVDCLELGATDYFTKPFESLDVVTDNLKMGLARYERWKKELGSSRKPRG